MNRERLLARTADLSYLASCAFGLATPNQERLKQIPLLALYKFSSYHSMQNVAYLSVAALQKQGLLFVEDPNFATAMQYFYGNSVRRLLRFDLEREKLCAFLEQEQISYLPLKGILLSSLYPKIGMRQMCDNDIAIVSGKMKKIRRYFQTGGYTVVNYGKGTHDTYSKGDLHFEIHRHLVPCVEKYAAQSAFCEEAVGRAQEKAQGNCLAFSDEDFYLYYLIHAYRHYSSAGCGLRTLMDLFVYRRTKLAAMDGAYLTQKLEQIGLTDFEALCVRLSEATFCADPDGAIAALSSADLEQLCYLASSGTYGTQRQRVENELKAMAAQEAVTPAVKRRYLLRRLFPKMEHYRSAFPKLSRFIVTIPFLWMWRAVRALFRISTFKREIKNVKEID